MTLQTTPDAAIAAKAMVDQTTHGLSDKPVTISKNPTIAEFRTIPGEFGLGIAVCVLCSFVVLLNPLPNKGIQQDKGTKVFGYSSSFPARPVVLSCFLSNRRNPWGNSQKTLPGVLPIFRHVPSPSNVPLLREKSPRSLSHISLWETESTTDQLVS